MFQLISLNKIIFLGIFIVIIQTFFGASFDTTTKFLGLNNNFLWYHYYALGLGFPLIFLIIYLIATKDFKRNILFVNKKDYLLPLFRGVTFMPVPIIIYYPLFMYHYHLFLLCITYYLLCLLILLFIIIHSCLLY